MKKLIEQNIHSSCTNANKPHCFDKSNHRCLAFFTLVLLGAACTLMKGQTVNYNYDASGHPDQDARKVGAHFSRTSASAIQNLRWSE